MRTHRYPGIDNSSIDRLYGLEPVFEPGAHAALETWAELLCPYCGETSGTNVDLTDQSRSYIEDCHVCCQAMQVTLRIDESGILRQIAARRMDD
jgi:Cysteine-rich CPXCG